MMTTKKILQMKILKTVKVSTQRQEKSYEKEMQSAMAMKTSIFGRSRNPE